MNGSFALPRERRRSKRRVCHYEDAANVGRLIQTLEEQGLTELVVTGVGVVSFESNEVSQALQRATSLKSLCLHDVSLNRASLLALLTLLQGMTNITKLAFARTKLPEEGLDALLEFLKENDVVVEVRFERLHYAQAEWKEPFAALLRANRAMTSLHLNHTVLGRQFHSLAAALAQNVTVKRLELENCGIGPSGARHFATALRSNIALRNVKLDRNRIGIHGATALADALAVNETISHLSLARASIPSPGIIALASVLGAHRSLVFVNLLENQTTDEAARAIVKAVVANRNICQPPVIPRETKTLQALLQAVQMNSQTKKQAFHSAAATEDKAPWGRCKLMVIGEGKAGKSATIRSLMQKRFVEEWQSTAGVDIVPAKALSGFKWEIDEETDFALEMINKLAALRFESTVTTESYSTTSASGSGSGSGSEVSSRSGSSFGSQDVHQQSQPFADYDEELFNDAQADLSTIKLLIWDLGGQSAFHCLHHLFMTSHGIYLLIFNLQRIAAGSAEAVRHLEFWMHSLALHAPGAPLVIAGTFSEDVDVKALLRCERTIAKIFRPLTSLVKIHKTSFYPIDNRTRKGTEFLREALHRAVHKQEQPRLEVPIKWLLCLNVISAMEDKLMYIDKVEALAKTYAGLGNMEVVDMLRYFHELGVILFFSNTSALRGIITIHPQWLMDELVKVIRDHDVHRYDNDRVDIEKNGLNEDLQTFRFQGIVSRDLLTYFWGPRANYLIDLMRSLLLLSSWNFRTSHDELFLIPSMVHRRQVQIESSAGSYGASFAMHLQYIPDGVFERLVCLSVQYSSYLKSEHEPELNATACEVDFEKFGRLTLIWDKNEIHCHLNDRMAAGQVVSIMQAMLKKVNEEFIGNALEWQVLCWVDKEKVPLEQARKMDDVVWSPKPAASSASSGYHETSAQEEEEEEGEDRFDAFLSTF